MTTKPRSPDVVNVRVLTEHRINVGTKENPEYKVRGDEYPCDKTVAKRLAAFGHVEILDKGVK